MWEKPRQKMMRCCGYTKEDFCKILFLRLTVLVLIPVLIITFYAASIFGIIRFYYKDQNQINSPEERKKLVEKCFEAYKYIDTV